MKSSGEIEPGSTILITTIGRVGIEIIITILGENNKKAVAFVSPSLKKVLKDTRGVDHEILYFTLGKDSPQRSFLK